TPPVTPSHPGYDYDDYEATIACRPSCCHAAGAPAFSAASAGARLLSHRAPMKRRPVTPSDAFEHSQTSGATITSGAISFDRSGAAACVTMRVFAAPPGTSTLAVTPV